MRSSALILLLLAANSAPQWLFTVTGCRYVQPEQVEQFNEQMNHDLQGCAKHPTPVADVYRCNDGGTYMVFYEQNKCERAVAHFRAHHRV